MRKMPFVILASSAVIGLAAAYYATHARKACAPNLPPNVFVSADQHGLVELPAEPKPLPPEPPLMPILLQPQPMPAPGDGREVTVSLRQPEEEETIPEPIPAPSPEPPMDVAIASPEEAPPSAELIAMPTEESAWGETIYLASQSVAPTPREEPVALPSLPGLVVAASQPSTSARWEVSPLTGTYSTALENLARLKFPATLRKQLQGTREFGELYIGLGPGRKCLWIYSYFGVDRLVRTIMRQMKKDGDEMACNLRVCLSRLQHVAGNANGEFNLPPKLVQAAGLGKDVVLIGVRDHFELWDANAWQEYSEGKPQTDAAPPVKDKPSHLPPEQTHGGIE